MHSMARRSKVEDQAYDYIKKQIETGKWAVGTQVKELTVSEALGSSRTPVRKALKRLEDEKYVIIKPNIGVYVLAKPMEVKDRRDRIYYLEALLQHIFYTLQLEEVTVDTQLPQTVIEDMKKVMNLDNDAFEKQEIAFWEAVFRYHSNTYMNHMVIQTMIDLYQPKGMGSNVLIKSRPIKLKHYETVIHWLNESNYVYARREIRILLNQLLINIIQGVD